MTTEDMQGIEGRVVIRRHAYGFPHIRALAETDLYYGLGFAHGRDRQVHIWLLKLAGQGRASEVLSGDDLLVESDRLMRWVDLAGIAAADVAALTAEARAVVDAYCRGVNDGAAVAGIPFEFRLAGYRRDEWTPADVLLILAMTGFVGLAQSQGEAEKLLVELLQRVDTERVCELFPIIEAEISDELVGVLRQVRLDRSMVPGTVPWAALLPSFQTSNNWVVAPHKSISGNALLCGDPHLALQIPSIWYLATLSGDEFRVSGATIPGTPIFGLARTRDLAWAPTYGAADVSDYFVEEVRGGCYRRGSDWLPFRVREESVRPKGRAPLHVRVYENEHGLLEGVPDEDGYYLCYAWTGRQRKRSVADSVDGFIRLSHVRHVGEAIHCFARMPFAAFNWVLADRGGNIGYQLSGCVPKRRAGTSGLLPYLGWDAANDWQGMLEPEDAPTALNPPEGIVVTANQDLNHLGRVPVMTIPMSSYRADRIRALLEEKEKLSLEDMQRFHYDRYSLQAETFMPLLRPLLPATEQGKLLAEWDLCYEADSRGAYLFDRVYEELLRIVFGEQGLGAEVFEYLLRETPLFSFLHGNFDRILLQEESVWFRDKSRESLLRTAIERGLAAPAVAHGAARRIKIENLFFAGRLPGFLGFDYTLEHLGSAATVAQGQVFKAAGRTLTFAPTVRVICDLGDDALHANIAGGASDRRFSKYYTSGFEDWKNGRYATFTP
jgi:penicillin amidase